MRVDTKTSHILLHTLFVLELKEFNWTVSSLEQRPLVHSESDFAAKQFMFGDQGATEVKHKKQKVNNSNCSAIVLKFS